MSNCQAMWLGSLATAGQICRSITRRHLNLKQAQVKHPEVKPQILHFLLYSENLAHTFLPWPNPPDMDVKGFHKTRQTRLGEGRPQNGSARDISALRSGKDRGRDRLNHPKHGWLPRGWVQTLPFPSKVFGCSRYWDGEKLCLGKSFFPFINFRVAHAGGLQMLSRRGEVNHSHRNTHHGPGSSLLLLLHSPQRRFSHLLPPDSLGASLVYKLWGSGQRLIMYS